MKKEKSVETKGPVAPTVVRLGALGFEGCIVCKKPCPYAESLRRLGNGLHSALLQCGLAGGKLLPAAEARTCEYTPPPEKEMH